MGVRDEGSWAFLEGLPFASDSPSLVRAIDTKVLSLARRGGSELSAVQTRLS